MLKRRSFVRNSLVLGSGLGMGLGLQNLLPAWARTARANDMQGLRALSGNVLDLTIAEHDAPVAGGRARHIVINEEFPAPLLRWQEGSDLLIRVHNRLQEDTSIHWHGILLPAQMDGVPGVSFPGIAPGETFEYSFPVQQAGTYWYHSHSGLQEQIGHYGPIIIDPVDEDPVRYDREFVVLLSDWTFESPQRLFAELKKMGHSLNFQQRTMADLLRDIQDHGLAATLADRSMWGEMRMNATDIADVTGATYTYLLNGHTARGNWYGLFTPGETVRLRFINASAMSIFNIRIPGLPMTVVQADGLDVQAVETDEFQIGTAETFDVLVRPAEGAYTLMCEANDRSGYVRGTLSSAPELTAEVPALRERPLLTMKDMGMGGMHEDHLAPESAGADAVDHAGMDHSDMDQSTMDHSAMDHGDMEMDESMQAHNHAMGPGVVNVAMNPANRLHERPLGLEQVPHRVLVYTDLKSLQPNPDQRAPGREMELHLTSNMERYMWSFDGQKFSEVDGPIVFHRDERLRLTLVNDTMMPHPIHLHGMFFDVVTDRTETHKPRKHTIVVKPGEKLSVDITADAAGDWAFHCHLLYHMFAGMMRVVSVRESMPEDMDHAMPETMEHGQDHGGHH